MTASDYYSVLGVERTATKDVIVSAFRKLAMKWHPDRHQDITIKVEAERRFKDIQQAYATLSDETLRLRYDSSRSGSNRHHPGYDFSEHARRHAEAAAEVERRWRQSLPKGTDVKKKASISLIDAVNGGRVTIDETYYEICDECDGDGAISVPCPTCHGQAYRRHFTCRDCYGVGHSSYECEECGGRGKNKETRTFTVRTPPGTVEGTVLVVKESGKESKFGGLNGDLLITVTIKAEEGWRVKSADILGNLKIGYATAMFGGVSEVTLPTGKTLQVSIPPRTNSGKRIRLAGQGLYNAGGKSTGDALLLVSIVLPASKRKLTPEMEAVIRQIDGIN